MAKGGIVGAITQPVVSAVQKIGRGVGEVAHGKVGQGVKDIGGGAVNVFKGAVGVTADNHLVAADVAKQVAANPGAAVSTAAAIYTGAPVDLGGYLNDISSGVLPEKPSGGGGAAPSLGGNESRSGAPMLPASQSSISPVLLLGGAAIIVLLARRK